MFLVSLEFIKCVFYSPRQRPKFRSRKNQVQSKKTSFNQFNTWLDQSRFSIASLTPGSTDQDYDISKNMKCEKAQNLLVSSRIHDPSIMLFKEHHKLSLRKLFRGRNHHIYVQLGFI